MVNHKSNGWQFFLKSIPINLKLYQQAKKINITALGCDTYFA